MATNATNDQSCTDDERRAQWESLEFRVPTPGAVQVENVSYGEDSKEHVYVVSVESEIPFDCTCPSWKYHNPEKGCKHMIAVENQPAILMAASQTPVLADGGLPRITHHVESIEDGGERYARCEGCSNESIFGGDRILHDRECPHYARKEANRFKSLNMDSVDILPALKGEVLRLYFT